MTGPYTIKITDRLRGTVLVEADAHEITADPDVNAAASRYRATDLYAPGSGPLQVAERASVVWAAFLIEAGEEVSAEVHGTDGGKPCLCRSNSVRRDRVTGTVHSSIGSRFNEREFKGLV